MCKITKHSVVPVAHWWWCCYSYFPRVVGGSHFSADILVTRSQMVVNGKYSFYKNKWAGESKTFLKSLVSFFLYNSLLFLSIISFMPEN